MQLPAWFSISLWILLGYSMILFNKVLLTTWGFNFPFLLTTWHCILASVLTQILSRTTNLFPAVSEGKIGIKDYIRKMVPLALLFAYGLVAGNIAYRYISLSYIQMIKAVTPVPLLLLTFLTGREKPSVVQLFIVMVVRCLSWPSIVLTVFQSSAVCTDCCRMLLLDILLRDSKVDSLSMLYYTAPISAVVIGLGFIAFEAPRFSFDVLTPSLTGALVANGLLAFFLNLAVLFLVSNCSAVVMSVSGPIKDILIVLTSVLFFHAPVTVMQLVGFSISLYGLNLFRQFKANPAAMHQQGRAIRNNIWGALRFTIKSLTTSDTNIDNVLGLADSIGSEGEEGIALQTSIASALDEAALEEAAPLIDSSAA